MMDMRPDPVKLGLLFDFPQRDDSFEHSLRVGLDEAGGAGDREIEFVSEAVRGLPFGSEYAVRQGYQALVEAGVLAVVGPSISDNALIVRDLASAAETPTINWSGGERTRGPWMFHYQVGSLEEEPLLLATRMSERGLRRAFVLYDRSPVGGGYLENFEAACGRLGHELVGTAALSPATEDATEVVARAVAGGPDVVVYLGLGAAAHAVAAALNQLDAKLPVLANSALMFGYMRRDWRDAWAGWEYVDTIADDNPEREALRARDRRAGGGPTTCAAYDIGRLVATALARADHLTRAGMADGLRRVKRLSATTGERGTLMGFGVQDHAALKGEYLVLREWRDGRSVAVDR